MYIINKKKSLWSLPKSTLRNIISMCVCVHTFLDHCWIKKSYVRINHGVYDYIVIYTCHHVYILNIYIYIYTCHYSLVHMYPDALFTSLSMFGTHLSTSDPLSSLMSISDCPYARPSAKLLLLEREKNPGIVESNFWYVLEFSIPI